MKKLFFLLCFVSGVTSLTAQIAMPGLSASYIAGNSQFTGSGKFTNAGYSVNFETVGLFCVTGGYQFINGHQKFEKPNGTKHIRLRQNSFKFLVGYGLPLELGDKSGLVISGQYGFLAGTDKLNVWHEYPNGRITYGNDKTSGVYKALRVFPSVVNLKLTYLRKSGFMLFVAAEKVFRKKRDLFEFWDQNEIKHAYNNVYSGGSNQYYAWNDTYGFNIHAGIGFVITND